jgi:uncharacterized coiled-coil protein SlyX
MSSQYTVLERLTALEATVATLETKVTVQLKIDTLTDTVGTLLAEIATIQTQLQVVQLPEDSRYYLSQNELDFIRQGMSDVSKLIVELEDLRDSLVRLSYSKL